MRFMGSKRRIAKDIESYILGNVEILDSTVYWEPFLGGGNSFEVIAPNFPVAIGIDAHPDIPLMWDALVNQGWQPPHNVTKGEYDALKNAEPSALRGFVGFGCSFGGKWFGGYARGGVTSKGEPCNYPAQSARSVERAVAKLKSSNTAYSFYEMSFFDPRIALNCAAGDVMYCDPPYKGTTEYHQSGFDSVEFWARAAELSDSGVHVFVSEYEAPSEWECVFEKSLTKNVKGGHTERPKAVERLWTLR